MHYIDPVQIFDNTVYASDKFHGQQQKFRGTTGPFDLLKTKSFLVSQDAFLAGQTTNMGLRMGLQNIPGMSFFAIPTDSLFASLRDYANLAAQMLGGELRLKAMLDGIIGKIGALSNLRPRCGQFRTKLPFFGTGYNPNDFGANLQQHPARVTPESLREFLTVKQHLAIPLKEFLMGIASQELVHEYIGTLGETVSVSDEETGRTVTTWPQTHGAFMPSAQLVSTKPGMVVEARGKGMGED